MERTSFLTANEKRAAVGYEALDTGGDLPGAPPASKPPSGSDPAILISSGKPGLAPSFKYSPNQPRVPRGHTDGGQWTDGGGGTGSGSASTYDRGLSDATPDNFAKPGARLVQAEEQTRGTVDLQQEEVEFGGHTIRRHVGRPENELLEIVRRDRYEGPFITVARRAQGSFHTLQDANGLVNRTLEANGDQVHAVATGAIADVEIEKRFGYVTGKEAFRPDADAEPYIRPTYSVRVRIQTDNRAPKGYRVFSAYPFNPRSSDE